MITVAQWTGREAVLLQSVMRLSNRDFARRLGVSFGTVMKWRRHGAELVPRPPTQQILDATLREVCTEAERQAFFARLGASPTSALPEQRDPADAPSAAAPGPFSVVSHKFLPVYAAAVVTALWDTAEERPEGTAGLERRALPVDCPQDGTAELWLYRCGVVMLHLEEHLQPDTITDLAMWRYRTYLEDRSWAGQYLTKAASEAAGSPLACPAPEYVLSVYELGAHSWTPEALPTAMQLLATPSVLVNRRDPDNITSLGVEEELIAGRWEHPDAVEYSGAMSMGLAGWSGVAYHPLPAERALTTGDIVNLERDVQALWALSMQVYALLEQGQDLAGGMRAQRAAMASAYSRITQSGPTETVQHRLMRKAILATSELPERLKAAHESLRP